MSIKYKSRGFLGFLFSPFVDNVLNLIRVVGSDVVGCVYKCTLDLVFSVNCPNREFVAVFVEQI